MYTDTMSAQTERFPSVSSIVFCSLKRHRKFILEENKVNFIRILLMCTSAIENRSHQCLNYNVFCAGTLHRPSTAALVTPTQIRPCAPGHYTTTYREKATDELGDAAEGSAVRVILGQAAAEQTQAALPHAHRQRARCRQELGPLAALQVPQALLLS